MLLNDVLKKVLQNGSSLEKLLEHDYPMKNSRIVIVSVILIIVCITLYGLLYFVANPWPPRPDSSRWSDAQFVDTKDPFADYEDIHFMEQPPRTAKKKQRVPDDIVTDSALNTSAIAIAQLQQQWHEMFFQLYIPQRFASLFSSPNNSAHDDDATSKIDSLLTETRHFFESTSNVTRSKQFILWNHRHIISIRRYVMILCEYLQNSAKKFNTETYHFLLHDVFLAIHIKYSTILKNEFAKAWFLIHISKSAGSTICATQKSVGYEQLQIMGTNCNIPYHGAPIKNEDEGIFSCDDLEYMRKMENTQFMASERPMTGHKVSNKPILCNEYQYILPVRHPLARVVSTVNEYHLDRWYFPFEILIRYEEGYEYNDLRTMKLRNRRKVYNKSRYCSETFVKLEENVYGPLRDKYDFSEFVSHLFANEKETDDLEEVLWQNNMKCKYESNLDNIERSMYKYNDMTHITLLGRDKKYGIKITEGFKHRSNVSLIRGYCSNINTRWIGYQREQDTSASYDAIFEKSYNINVTHWSNAVEFMMGTDYILPFESVFDHDIFKFALYDLWDFGPYINRRRLFQDVSFRDKYKQFSKLKNDQTGKKNHRVRKRKYRQKYKKNTKYKKSTKYRRKVRKRTRGMYKYRPGRRQSKRATRTEWAQQHVAFNDRYHISTKNIIEAMSDEEIEFIINKNLLDLQLFNMAKQIADVDVILYSIAES